YVGTGRFKMPKEAPLMEALEQKDAPVGIVVTEGKLELPLTPSPVAEAKMCSVQEPATLLQAGAQ
ncbi:MAG TPA: hypothetical protein VIM67_01500, partial [Terriglobus sp.]